MTSLPAPLAPTPPLLPALTSPPVAAVPLPRVVPPLPFHRLARADGRSRWWRPLLVLLVAAVGYAVLELAALLVLVVFDDVAGTSLADRAVATSMTDPFTFGAGFVLIALMMPALLLALRLVGVRPVGLVFSVAGRLRWGWAGAALGRVVVVLVVSFSITQFVVGPLTGEPAVLAPRPGAVVFLLLAVLVVPVQAAAEELVFRGWAMQAVGTWLRHPLFAILLPLPLFVLGHTYDVWGQLDVATFGLAAGWLAWRTGGLEAPIALHVVNNGLITVLVALGYADPDATQGSPVSLAVSSVTLLVVVVWLVRSFDARELARPRVAPAPPAPSSLAPSPFVPASFPAEPATAKPAAMTPAEPAASTAR